MQALKSSLPKKRNGDTLQVSERAAVWYRPDSAEQQRRLQDDTLRIGMDDYLYYMHESLEYLEKRKLPVLECKPHQLLRFVKNDGAIRFMHIDSLEYPWGVILFDPSKEPLDADILDMEGEYKKFYR